MAHKFRSANTSMPAVNRAISAAARVCSPVVTGPNSASTTAWVPHSPTATRRTWGKGLGAVALPLRPNASSLAGVSGTSRT
ncbi:MAG: hypothetical protein ACRDTT_01670, partial [Pseudonocardiaceae bacterium]